MHNVDTQRQPPDLGLDGPAMLLREVLPGQAAWGGGGVFCFDCNLVLTDCSKLRLYIALIKLTEGKLKAPCPINTK